MRTPLPALDYPVDTEYDATDTSQQIRTGHSVAIVAVGTALKAVLEAADVPDKDGKAPTVISALLGRHSLSPAHHVDVRRCQ